MVTHKVTKYAMTVTSQVNENIKTQKYDWTNIANAIGDNSKTYASSIIRRYYNCTSYKTELKKDKNGRATKVKKCAKGEYLNEKPYTVSAHDFHLDDDVPSNAVVKKVTVEAMMRSSGWGVPIPHVRWNIYGGAWKERKDNTKSFGEGWNNGIYYSVVDGDLYVPSDSIYSFVLDEKAVKESGATLSDFTDDIFGVDLEFVDAWTSEKQQKSAYIYLLWVRCVFEYEVPEPKLAFTNPIAPNKGTVSNPLPVGSNLEFTLDCKLSNSTIAPNGSTQVQIDLPYGTELISTSDNTHFNTSTNTWTTDLGANTSKTLTLHLKTKKGGSSVLTGSVGDLSTDYYYTTVKQGKIDTSNYIEVSAVDEIHKDYNSCINFKIGGHSEDTTIGVFLSSIINLDSTKYKWTLDKEGSRNVDSLSTASQSRSQCYVELKESGDYFISLNYCCYPTASPISFGVHTSNDATVRNVSFDVLPPYTFSLTNNPQTDKDILIKPSLISVNNHRVMTDLDTNASIIPIVFDSTDSNMVMNRCSIAMDKWDDLDYIGCVPLEQTHFDPESTYKDALLDNRYKNKRYMGKKLASDEDITLNVRLHPQQVTTIQGLIDMDKPVPINANHKCFEGDSLNHRGWVELYGVKAKQTGNNPHWYKCDIDVKYLTHNLHTRLKIDKGKRVDDYSIPSLYTESFKSGENLSDMDGDYYFDTITDGTFHYQADYYDEDLEQQFTFNDYERNNFNISNKQYIRITSHKPLTSASTVNFSWSSALIDDSAENNKENNVSRVVRLLDKTGKAVFEYEYDDYSASSDDVTAKVIYRVMEDEVLVPYEEDIAFRYNPSDVTNEFDEIVVDTDTDLDEIIDDGEAHFGTTLSLILNNGKLSIRDYGFNGREVAVDKLELPDGEYYYQVEWINNNQDYETEEVDCYFDFQVFDTILSSTYSDRWSDLVVSPFPVADKPILFTRKAEEGTIYYYKDDGEEFSYLIEPYYVYHNGTDLVTRDGISIFNLNYGYEIVYIQNGLVRLGFNRLTGQLYLGRYDKASESYITIARLHLGKYDDINLNNISDDKIEIQASDCTFTIYRGHPYIKIKHELEDIFLDTQYNTVWAEQLGDNDAVELPVFWDLMNNQNLLPKLKSTDYDVDVGYVQDRTQTTLTFSSVTSSNESDTPPNCTTGADITFTLSDGGAMSTYTDVIDLNDTVCSFGEISWDITCDSNVSDIPSLTFTKPILQSGQTTDFYAQVVNACNRGVGGVTVNFYEDYVPKLLLKSSADIIQVSDKPSFTASLVDEEDGSHVCLLGQTIYFYEEYVVSSVKLTAPKNIIQSNDTLQFTATVKDSDGSLIKDETVNFERVVDSSEWNVGMSASKEIMQTGETSTITVTVKDANNNAVENVWIDWYLEVDD